MRGGIGVFSNAANLGSLSQALTNTGLPSGIQQINCVGPAAPIPDWNAYANDPTTVPTVAPMARVGTVFSNAAPNVTLFSRGFRAAEQRSARTCPGTAASWTRASTLNVRGHVFAEPATSSALSI